MDEAKHEPGLAERTVLQAWDNKISARVKELEAEQTDLCTSLGKVNYALNCLREIQKEMPK